MLLSFSLSSFCTCYTFLRAPFWCVCVVQIPSDKVPRSLTSSATPLILVPSTHFTLLDKWASFLFMFHIPTHLSLLWGQFSLTFLFRSNIPIICSLGIIAAFITQIPFEISRCFWNHLNTTWLPQRPHSPWEVNFCSHCVASNYQSGSTS